MAGNRKDQIEDGVRTLSRERMERAQQLGNRSGLFLWLFLFACLGAVGWYWFQVYAPEQEARRFEKETMAMTAEAKAQFSRLSEWSDEASLKAFLESIDELRQREGVERTELDRLSVRVGELLEAQVERAQKFDALMSELNGFSSESKRAAVVAFDEKVREARKAFDEGDYSKLRTAWRERRSEIGANKIEAPGELTIRTSPSKAEVYLDGKLLSKTPFSAGGVLSGKRELTIRKEGYIDKVMMIEVESEKMLDLGIQELDPIKGSARFEIVGGRRKDKISIEIEESAESLGSSAFQVVQGFQAFEGRSHTVEGLRIGGYSIFILQNEKVIHRDTFVVKKGELTQYTYEF